MGLYATGCVIYCTVKLGCWLLMKFHSSQRSQIYLQELARRQPQQQPQPVYVEVVR